ncbi:MAG TPA: hypothetical protein VLQ80_14420 [Candidatus Saccharimonadia bacterium]|nr:hypothetical protein [Candidatus Saccharimonadia bacterium]
MTTFQEIASKIQHDYEAGFSCTEIATMLTTRHVPPVLGAAVWTKELVDRTMVHYESQRRAQAAGGEGETR